MTYFGTTVMLDDGVLAGNVDGMEDENKQVGYLQTEWRECDLGPPSRTVKYRATCLKAFSWA